MVSSALFLLLLLLLTAHNSAPSPANISGWSSLSSSAPNNGTLGQAANDSLWQLANVTGLEQQLGDRLLKLQRVRERPFQPMRVMLSIGAFLRKLGAKALDNQHFSVVPPEQPYRDRALVVYPVHRVPPSVRKLVRHFMRRTFGHNRRRHKDFAAQLKNYLSNYSVCPVKYRWYNFGPKFWPRWVRLGSCLNREHSCSLPPGMQCRPDQLRRIKVLRYVCPLDWQIHQCDWRPIDFPVLVSCTCSC